VWQMKGNDMSATSVARSLNKRGLKGVRGEPYQLCVVIWVPYLLSVIGRGAPLTHPTSDDWLGGRIKS